MNKENVSKSRKPYIKPCVAIEDFALDQFVAKNCTVIAGDDWKTQLKEKDYLAYAAVMRTNQFVADLQCGVHADVMTDDMDTLCYHTATSPLFTS